MPPGWPIPSLLRTKLPTLIPSNSGLLEHPIPKAQKSLSLATIDTPALLWKPPIAVPMWTIPLVLLVPFVTRPVELRLIHCIVEGKTTRAAPLQAILSLHGGTTWLKASPPARLRQRLLLLRRGHILVASAILPAIAVAELLVPRVKVSIVFATRVSTIKTPPTPPEPQPGHRPLPRQSTRAQLDPRRIPLLCNPPETHRDIFRTVLCLSLDSSRLPVDRPATDTSALRPRFTPVVILPIVSVLTDFGTKTLLRLLPLHMASLIGTTTLLHLIRITLTPSCLFRTWYLFASREPPGRTRPLICTGLSSCTSIFRLSTMARLLRT